MDSVPQLWLAIKLSLSTNWSNFWFTRSIRWMYRWLNKIWLLNLWNRRSVIIARERFVSQQIEKHKIKIGLNNKKYREEEDENLVFTFEIAFSDQLRHIDTIDSTAYQSLIKKLNNWKNDSILLNLFEEKWWIKKQNKIG